MSNNSNNTFDNSHAAAIKQAEIARQNNWPRPTQQPGQSADSINTVHNTYDHLGKKG
jgi:hypothetical protein